MKGKKGSIMLWFVTIIIAVIVVGILFGLIAGQQKTTAITDDQFTGSTSSCVRFTDSCYLPGSLSLVNATTGATLTITTANYTECGTGQDLYGAVLLNSTYNGDTINASYSQVSCERVTGMTANIINYIPVLLALAVLVFVWVFGSGIKF